MYTILKRSKLTKPTRNWGKRPRQNDTSVADDVERIHYYRNKISHLDASEIETAVFNNSVLDLIGVMYYNVLHGMFFVSYFISVNEPDIKYVISQKYCLSHSLTYSYSTFKITFIFF